MTEKGSVVRRSMEHVKPYRGLLVALLVLELAAAPLWLLTPIPLKIVVDNVIGLDPMPQALLGFVATPGRTLLFAGLLLGLVALLINGQGMAVHALRTKVGQRLTLDFQSKLLAHTQRLSLSFHDTKGTADSIYRIQWDAPSIQNLVVFGGVALVSAAVMVLATIVVTAGIDRQLALIALGVAPTLFGTSYLYNSKMRERYVDASAMESRAQGVLQEVLTSLRVVKSFGREQSEKERFLRHSKTGVRARFRLAIAEGTFGLMVGLTVASGTAAVLIVGAGKVRSGALSTGELLMIITYLGQLYGPLQTISNNIAGMQSSLAGAHRAFELLDQAPEVVERPGARPVERANGDVEFREVTFSYNGDRPALGDVSFKVPAGTRLGVAGKTGAGKTTLASLVTRFYDPDEGKILLDGVDLKDLKLSDLRNQFAIVLQEPVLFSTSIAQNIAYGRPDAGIQEIKLAAQAANVDEFIESLPESYDTKVGERGMQLSGGERQRVALARAFLKDAPILILDEPTSSVDIQTEAGIIDAMERLMQGRTTFMIAHRLGTLEKCDALLIVDAGKTTLTTVPKAMAKLSNSTRAAPRRKPKAAVKRPISKPKLPKRSARKTAALRKGKSAKKAITGRGRK